MCNDYEIVGENGNVVDAKTTQVIKDLPLRLSTVLREAFVDVKVSGDQDIKCTGTILLNKNRRRLEEVDLAEESAEFTLSLSVETIDFDETVFEASGSKVAALRLLSSAVAVAMVWTLAVL